MRWRERRSRRRARFVTAASALGLILAARPAWAAPRPATPYHKVTSYILSPSTPWSARPASAKPKLAPPSSAVGHALTLAQCADCPRDDACSPCDADTDTAVRHALQIWNQYLASPVGLAVRVELRPLGRDIQGVHIPSTGYYGLAFNPESTLVYPAALASCIEGRSLNSPDADIYVQINRNLDWYKKVDGLPLPAQRDLVTATLHEVCHGLGVETSLMYSEAEGSFGWGYSAPDLKLSQWSVYDSLLTVEDKQRLDGAARLVDLHSFFVLKQILPDVVLEGLASLRTLVAGKVATYFDASWQPGSSLSHLDAFSHLMSHFLPPGNVHHRPEAALVELLRSLGWPTEPIVQAQNLKLACINGAVEGTFEIGSAVKDGDVVDPDGFLVLRAPAGGSAPPALADGKLEVGDSVGGWVVAADVRAPKLGFADARGCASGTRYAVAAYNAPPSRVIKNLRIDAPASAVLP